VRSVDNEAALKLADGAEATVTAADRITSKEEDVVDPEFDEEGYGVLNPFQKHAKRSDEEVNIALIRERSHELLTYHLPLPEDFDRDAVLPVDQLRELREIAAAVVQARVLAEQMANEQAFIVQEMVDLIVGKAARDLFDTPVPSEIPTDSFADDFAPEFFVQQEEELKLKSIEEMNR